MFMRVVIIFFCFLLLLNGSNSNAQVKNIQNRLPLIDGYIDSIMKQWNIPGLALGIVYKDQLIYAKGYGFRDVEAKLPVQPTTVFPIASNTKLFTATLATMLATEGKLDLDKPVKSYVPDLNFYNDELNAHVSMRDLLSHRTGLPRYDGIWVGSQANRKGAVSNIQIMKPQQSFRSGFIYNNMMYATAGYVMEEIMKKSWEDLINEKILLPLQMKSTFFSRQEMVQTKNYAKSYLLPDTTSNLKINSFEAESEALGPAGTMKSTVEDMSRWMIVQLSNGRLNEKQLIPAKAIQETLVPHIISDNSNRWKELSHSLYALGRNVQTYKGFQIATHTGSIDGYYSNMTLMPDDSIGIFLVYNSNRAGLMRTTFAFPIIDRLLNLSYTDWNNRIWQEYEKSRIARDSFKDSVLKTQVKNTSPSHPLNAFTGTYTHPAYGSINISTSGNQLIFSFRKQKSLLSHFHYNQFTTKEEDDVPIFRVNFIINSKGEIDKLTTRPFGDPEADFVKKS
jgi:CubicO group peptidase (beta-lactamase class C family)